MAAEAGWPRSTPAWWAGRYWLLNPAREEDEEDEEEETFGPLGLTAVLRSAIEDPRTSPRSRLWPDGLSRDAAIPLLTALGRCVAANSADPAPEPEARMPAARSAGARRGC